MLLDSILGAQIRKRQIDVGLRQQDECGIQFRGCVPSHSIFEYKQEDLECHCVSVGVGSHADCFWISRISTGINLVLVIETSETAENSVTNLGVRDNEENVGTDRKLKVKVI